MSEVTACAEPQFRQMIDELIVDELPARKWEKLRKHLAVCPVCRARYNKAVLAERMLHGGPQAASRPSPSELDRIAQAVFQGDVAVEKPAWQRLLQWFAPPQRWATGLAAAAAAVALVPLYSQLQKGAAPAGSDGEFQSRGGKKAPVELYASHPELKPPEVEARTAGLRAFCLMPDKVQALEPTGKTPPTCERAAQLKLAVNNTGRYQKVFLVGLDADHDLKWYAPRPTAENQVIESVPAPIPQKDREGEGLVDVPVGASVRLVVNHAPGPVRIFALFSDKPVESTEVEAAAKELAARKTALKDAESLPLKRPDVLQRSLLIDVGP